MACQHSSTWGAMCNGPARACASNAWVAPGVVLDLPWREERLAPYLGHCVTVACGDRCADAAAQCSAAIQSLWRTAGFGPLFLLWQRLQGFLQVLLGLSQFALSACNFLGIALRLGFGQILFALGQFLLSLCNLFLTLLFE